MRRLTPILLALLQCGAPAFAAAAESSSKVTQNALFDQLLGTWDVSYEIFDKDGKVRRYRGQVRYNWILDGKAVQETWTSDSKHKTPQAYGTTITFYDPKRQYWTAVWVYPEEGMTTIVTGGEVNGSFVLTGPDPSGALQRWSTSVVDSDSAIGRFDISSDNGKTWRLVGMNHMQRHRG